MNVVPRFVLAGLATLVSLCVLAAPAGAAEAPPQQPREVPLPYTFQDEQGTQWVVQQNGVIAPGNTDVFDAGGALFVGGEAAYNAPTATAQFDAARNEVALPAVPMAGLHVSRRVAVDAAAGWCRWTEVLENRGVAPVHARVRVNFDLGAAAQNAQPINDEKTKRPMGLAVFDGNRGIAMLAAGRRGRVAPEITWQQGGDQVNVAFDVDVQARQAAVLVHFQAVRASLDDADTFVRSMKDADVLKDLPPALAPHVVNFPVPQQFAGNVDVLRGDMLDVVELRGGDRYKGTIVQPTFPLQTAFGPIELPAGRVAAMVSIGEVRPTQLLVTTDGEAFSGTLRLDAIKLELSSGQMTAIPVNGVARFGYRTRAGEAADPVAAAAAAAGSREPFVLLGSGDRVIVRPPAWDVPVLTRYGSFRLRPEAVAVVTFQADGQPVHELTLTDGSRFAGLVGVDHLDLTMRDTGKAVGFPTASTVRLQLAPPPDEDAAAAAAAAGQRPLLALSNGDRLVGSLSGRLVLDAAFDTIDVDALEVRGLQPTGAGAEVQATLWDGATLRGRVRDDTLHCALRCGVTLAVPVSLLEDYAQPQPKVPAKVAERVRGAVADLGAGSPAVRDRAAETLSAMGAPVAELLRSLRDQQSPEARTRLDQILAAFDAATRPAPMPPPPADGAQPVPNAPGLVGE